MRTASIFLALVIGATPAAAVAQQSGCADGSRCQLAATVIDHVLTRAGDLGGRNLFIDLQSFSALGPELTAPAVAGDVARRLGRPFRTDVSSTDSYRPDPRHSPRWGLDPYVIRLVNATAGEARVVAQVEIRFNVRSADNIDASAAMMDLVRGEYVLERGDAGWTVISSRRLLGPF